VVLGEVGHAEVLLGAGDAGECSAPVVVGPYARRVAPELARPLWDDSLHCVCVSLQRGCLEKKLGWTRRSRLAATFAARYHVTICVKLLARVMWQLS